MINIKYKVKHFTKSSGLFHIAPGESMFYPPFFKGEFQMMSGFGRDNTCDYQYCDNITYSTVSVNDLPDSISLIHMDDWTITEEIKVVERRLIYCTLLVPNLRLQAYLCQNYSEKFRGVTFDQGLLGDQVSDLPS